MLEVVRLDLQEAEDTHDLADWHSWIRLNQVEQTWDILLHVELHLDVLERWPDNLPVVLQSLICNLFELVYSLEELVHIRDTLVEQYVLRVFWNYIRFGSTYSAEAYRRPSSIVVALLPLGSRSHLRMNCCHYPFQKSLLNILKDYNRLQKI